MRFFWALALVILVVLVAQPVLSQCVMCKTALTGSPEGQAMSRSLGRGILVLLAAPYLVVAVFTGLLLRKRIAHGLRHLGGRIVRRNEVGVQVD